MNIISTWIYLDSPQESSEYPQAGRQSHLEDFHNIYWKCIGVFFAAGIQHNPDCRHILFSNRTWEEIPVVDGKDLKAILQNRGVELVTLPLTWQTPVGYYGKWRNQFYIFDVLAHLEHHFSDSDRVLVLDSDCLINKPLSDLFDEIGKNGLMVLPMGYPEEKEINGITRVDMREIYRELDGRDPGFNPVYYGGEIFAATIEQVKQINRLAVGVWAGMLKRFENGAKKFNEEAHFLSYLYFKIEKFGLLDGFVKRIWTSPQFNNVEMSDVNLPIWHLPSEKKGGIALLFKLLGKSDWTAYSPEKLGAYVGIPKRTHWLNWKHMLKYTFIYKWLTKG